MSKNPIKLIVAEEFHDERLDRFLADAMPQYSREYLKTLILKEHVSIGTKKIAKPSFNVKEGEMIEVLIPEIVPLHLEAENISIEILFEDKDLLVVNKPSGMLTHPTGKEHNGTLVNALLAHCNGKLSGINGVERPGIVHRLDRDTSGLLMVAKSDLAHRNLQKQLHSRTAKRCYRAIVQGLMPDSKGKINEPIGRHSKKRDKMAVTKTGRIAVTHWEVLSTIGDRFSILKLSLETGRTHQIRVHLAYLGNPVFGDPMYGSGLEKVLKFDTKGQVLQSFKLEFQHPITSEPLSFEIPPDEKFLRAKAFLENWIQ